MFKFKKKDDNLSMAEKYYRDQQRMISLTMALTLVGGIGGSAILDTYIHNRDKKINNERNASYIEDADVNTKFYEWCVNATDINTLVYFENNIAYLYEFDYELFDAETGIYTVIMPEGDYCYIPVANVIVFDTHEQAYEYAYQVVGNVENIICISYPNHNNAKVRTK